MERNYVVSQYDYNPQSYPDVVRNAQQGAFHFSVAAHTEHRQGIPTLPSYPNYVNTTGDPPPYATAMSTLTVSAAETTVKQSPNENSPEFCKALAKVAKPCPPWSVGMNPTENLSEEISRLDAFVSPHPHDEVIAAAVCEELRSSVSAVSGDATVQLHYVGCNGWGFFPYKARYSLALVGLADSDEVAESLNKSLREKFVVEKSFKDAYGTRCVVLTHSPTQRGVVLRFGGASVAAYVDTVTEICRQPRLSAVRQALNCVITLLRQSKIIDDADPGALSDEAVAVMMLSIANSYPELPAADRVVIDYFLTFGFKEHFRADHLSVSHVGMVSPVPKMHPEAALSIIDPASPHRNLARSVAELKLTFFRSSLEYCYHVVSEFTKETNPHHRRGQSPLSTMIGGEPYWHRVVDLGNHSVEPYHTFLGSQRRLVIDEMNRVSRRGRRR